MFSSKFKVQRSKLGALKLECFFGAGAKVGVVSDWGKGSCEMGLFGVALKLSGRLGRKA